MEAVEKPPLSNLSVEPIKVTVVVDESDNNIAIPPEDSCHKSNGISESTDLVKPEVNITTTESPVLSEESNGVTGRNDVPLQTELSVDNQASSSVNHDIETVSEISEVVQEVPCAGDGKDEQQKLEEPTVEYETLEESIVENEHIMVPSSEAERVTFETEILIETNDTEVIDHENTEVEEQGNAMLSDLGHSIELSEALRSSDVTDNAQNNNGAEEQEVFNKEELLDILEGNDEHHSDNVLKTNLQNLNKKLETKIALEQLSKLKSKRKTKKYKHYDKSKNQKSHIKAQLVPKLEADVASEVKVEENIVNDLVREWDEDDATDGGKTSKLLDESDKLLDSCDETAKLQENVNQQADTSIRSSIDSADGKNDANKSGEEGQPQRRLGRVIKKKVIFDPDNPDTFTKSKTVVKIKEPSTDREKEQTPSKKTKVDVQTPRSKSKSPLSKLQWKKPTPKTSQMKQNKRLTEVDKLLMDEGAVNMIYQLTPEATKGKKNMRTKAEFIKKLQSSTPDTKEMKFRERKKESKYDEGDARKISGGKQRSSLTSSVKSPSVCEDFEAHSADDSIIYRRHSSSSYSSSCMSPRRLSDVEANSGQVSRQLQQVANSLQQPDGEPMEESFMCDKLQLGAETINKNDCLSIKEKLNSKLNLALNKRKREHSKVEKPSKLKKVSRVTETILDGGSGLEYLKIVYENQRLAQICLQRPNIKCNLEVVKELLKALAFIDTLKGVSVTLLTSECVATCSDLNVTSLLDSDVDKRVTNIQDMAEAIRCTLQAVAGHSKLLCAAVSGNCNGLGLAVISLSDMVLASELTTFSTTRKPYVPAALIEPGLSVLTTLKIIPSNILNDMVLFGRPLSASEALQSGLVSRIIWPSKFDEQVHDIARDISAQPAQNIWLKKQLLSLKKGDSESTFLSCLEKERDLFIEYWNSDDGQDILRTAINEEKS